MRWRRQQQHWLTIAIALFMFSSFGRAQDRKDEEPPTIKFPDLGTLQVGLVMRVLDENSILVRVGTKTQRYDLLGVSDIDRTKKAAAAQAIDSLSRMVLNERVLIQHDPSGERLEGTNRLAGYFFRSPDRLLINLELVRQGYTGYSSHGMTTHHEVFSYQSKRAEQFKRGIWAPVEDLPAVDEEKLSEPGARPDPASLSPGQVYVTPHGKRYHRKGCQYLGASVKPASRDQIRGTHLPCKTCNPDE